MCSSEHHLRLISVMTGRPTLIGRVNLKPGWQSKRRSKLFAAVENSLEKRAAKGAISPEDKLKKQENANIDYMMRIHRRIDEIVDDQTTADALKPWYMFMCKRPCFHNEYLPVF